MTGVYKLIQLYNCLRVDKHLDKSPTEGTSWRGVFIHVRWVVWSFILYMNELLTESLQFPFGAEIEYTSN